MPHRIALSGAANCTYPEFHQALEKALQNFLCKKEKPVLTFRLADALNATRFAAEKALPYELQFTSDPEALISEADCVFIFWNGENRAAATDATLAKSMDKQLRIHRIQAPVAAAYVQITDLFADWAEPTPKTEEEYRYIDTFLK